MLTSLKRIRLWYGFLLLVVAIFGIRLFYLQVIRYDHYKNAALSDQLKQYKIPAKRGIIDAYDGNNAVPIVLNQTLYTLYADPTLVKQPHQVAQTIAHAIGGKTGDYETALTRQGTRYAVLAKKLTKSQSQSILRHKYPGIGALEQDYRVYPQGSLAAQVLGFVNNAGEGTYGVEQAMNSKLHGRDGQLKAITDIHGVPLAASNQNTSTPATAGDNVQLTLDIGMQQQMEKILKDEYKKTRSEGLSAIIMDPSNGHIKAMANYPTYNPAKYFDVSNPALFQNAAVSNAIEPGSTMKPLTAAAALDQGAVTPHSTFYDPSHWRVDGYNITDIEEDGGARTQSVASTLALSLNTGATWLLMQMSHPGGTSINMHGIKAWHDYMTKHYRFGLKTGIEQGYESAGYVPPTDNSVSAIHLRFANTSFGQGVQVTALQMAGALSSVLNGGTYYQPTLVDKWTAADGTVTDKKPRVLQRHVVSQKVSQELVPLMQNVVHTYYMDGFRYMKYPDDYIVGGKTGTAQIAKNGAYLDNIFNGTYMGFVGGDKPQYVIVVFNIKPHVPGYAGSYGGQPVFADLAHMLIEHGYVTPKS